MKQTSLLFVGLLFGCESGTQKSNDQPFHGSYLYVNSDSSREITHRFIGDSAYIENKAIGDPCLLSDANCKFTRISDSLCFFDISSFYRTGCSENFNELSNGRVCAKTRNIQNDSYELLYPDLDSNANEKWLLYKRVK